MAYYYTPALPADLNKGYDTFQKLNDVPDEHLDALLDTLVAHERETEKKCEVDIITWRGMMTKVSCIDVCRGLFCHLTNLRHDLVDPNSSL
jgi:RAT1-interacting protein